MNHSSQTIFNSRLAQLWEFENTFLLLIATINFLIFMPWLHWSQSDYSQMPVRQIKPLNKSNSNFYELRVPKIHHGCQNADFRVDTTLGPLSLRTLYYHSGGAILRLALKQNANLNQYFGHFFYAREAATSDFFYGSCHGNLIYIHF